MVYHLSETFHRVLIRHNDDRHCNLRQNVRKVLLSFSGCSARQRGALRTSAERATDSWVTGSQPGESRVTGPAVLAEAFLLWIEPVKTGCFVFLACYWSYKLKLNVKKFLVLICNIVLWVMHAKKQTWRRLSFSGSSRSKLVKLCFPPRSPELWK